MEIMNLAIVNLEKVGVGALLFLCAYLSNICLGIWRNVKIEGYDFDWHLIVQSIIKYLVLGGGIGLMSIVVSILPEYITCVGIDINDETMDVFDSVAIVVAFMTATIKYIKESYEKLKDILST